MHASCTLFISVFHDLPVSADDLTMPETSPPLHPMMGWVRLRGGGRLSLLIHATDFPPALCTRASVDQYAGQPYRQGMGTSSASLFTGPPHPLLSLCSVSLVSVLHYPLSTVYSSIPHSLISLISLVYPHSPNPLSFLPLQTFSTYPPFPPPRVLFSSLLSPFIPHLSNTPPSSIPLFELPALLPSDPSSLLPRSYRHKRSLEEFLCDPRQLYSSFSRGLAHGHSLIISTLAADPTTTRWWDTPLDLAISFSYLQSLRETVSIPLFGSRIQHRLSENTAYTHTHTRIILTVSRMKYTLRGWGSCPLP